MSRKIRDGWIKAIEIAAEVIGVLVILLPLFSKRRRK